jgi:pimeloyl-ACP methyl ester carboxylesterase
MATSLHGIPTALLPGTGSDDDYLSRALAGPLERAGATVHTVAPDPQRLVDGYLCALDRVLDATMQRSGDDGRIALGGVSLGAAVAVRWACAHPRHTAAVLAVLPPWTGAPDGAPAAVSARHTAATLRQDGLDATTATMRSSSPQWLADELARSWRRQWPALPDAMEEAAAYVAPTADDLRRLDVPLAVVAAADDAIHPAQVAVDWVSWAPRAALRTVRLEEFGPHPELLGQACLEALQAIG